MRNALKIIGGIVGLAVLGAVAYEISIIGRALRA